jgi:hypothetical protein
MKIYHIFYVVGIIFIFSTIAYFSYQYVFNLSKEIKAIVLIALIIIMFFIADFLKERDI